MELTENFTAPSHAMLSSAAAEAEGIKDETLEDVLVKTGERLSALRTRAIEYDLYELFEIPEIISEGSSEGEQDAMPTFGTSDKVDLLTHYANVSMESCKAWTRVIGIHGTDDVQESNMWLKELLINSSTTTLHRKVCETHDALDVQEQGGVTYFKIMMETIVEMTEEVAKAAKALIENFSLKKVQGENVTYARSRMMAVASVLQQSDLLNKDHYEAILDGLCQCSLPDFARIFENIKANGYTQAIAGTQAGLIGKTVYQRIEQLFNIGEARFRKLSSADEWPAKGDGASAFSVHLGKCYNCGGDHMLPDCKKEKDETRIAAARKKTNADRRAQGNDQGRGGRGRGGRGRGRGRGGGRGGGGRGGGMYDNKGRYKRPAGGEHVRVIDGKTHYPCNQCSWNVSHSTAYHAAFTASPSTFTMATTSYPGAVSSTAGSVSTITTTATVEAASKAATRALLTEITTASAEAERLAADPNEIAAAGMLNEILSRLSSKD